MRYSSSQEALIEHKLVFDYSDEWWAKYFKLRTLFYKSKEWKKLSKQVRQFFNFECQVCSRKAYDVHHIIELFKDPTLALTWKNLTLLCRRCHKKVHQPR